MSRVPVERWTHVAFVMTVDALTLYMNGIMVGTIPTQDHKFQPNEEKLYIGGMPTYDKTCKLAFYLRQLKVYRSTRTGIPAWSIEADAFGSLGQLESSFIKLSCVQCNLSEAKAKVITGYHICTDLELFSGGFQVIRILGWNEKNEHIVQDSY